jgi:integrase
MNLNEFERNGKQKICNQQVVGSSPTVGSIILNELQRFQPNLAAERLQYVSDFIWNWVPIRLDSVEFTSTPIRIPMALLSKVHVRELKKPKKGVYPWIATYKEAGSIRKKYFRCPDAANEFKKLHEAEADAHGTKHRLNDVERSAVVETRELLAEVGLTLREAVIMAANHQRMLKRSAPVGTLIGEFIRLKDQEGRSARHLRDLRGKLGRFAETFGSCQTASVSSEQITEWLTGLNVSAASILSYRRILVGLFNDAIRRRYREDNPAAAAIKPKSIESEIGILTPFEAARLLEHADEAILPAIAIGLFAGVRDEEIHRLDWSDVDLNGGYIEIKARNAKASRRRLIKIRDGLAAWLQLSAAQTGAVWPANGRKRMEAARAAAGFNGAGNQTWPRNAMRHSFASYHLAEFQDAAALALELGHADTGIIFRHYRELVRPKEARNYWTIFPATAER